MKFFITGSTGFIGQHLCHLLVEQGHHVVALIRDEKKQDLLPKNNIELLTGSLLSFKDHGFTIPACDCVIHLAGTVTAQKISQYHKDNFEGVQDLLDMLKRQKWIPKRIIFVSSQAAAGPSVAEKPLTENDPAHPVDVYGQAKLKAEQVLWHHAHCPVTIVRPPSVIGPRDMNVLNLFKIAKFGFGFIPNKKAQPISFISVFDLIRALVLLSADKSDINRLYFVSHQKPTTPQELWEKAGKLLNKKIKIIRLPMAVLFSVMKTQTLFATLFKVTTVFDKKYYDQLSAEAWLISSEALEKDFDWKATDSLDKALKKTYDSYVKLGWV